jgi:hypothetical protein
MNHIKLGLLMTVIIFLNFLERFFGYPAMMFQFFNKKVMSVAETIMRNDPHYRPILEKNEREMGDS